MALTRKSQRFNSAIWPGFVDAMTGLLLVLMFVLTIFMVIQFVLRETITGQESELINLADEIAVLSSALGIAEAEGASLRTDLRSAEAELTERSALIDRLTQERDAAASSLATAQTQITSFEAQVAGLLAEQSQANDQIATLSEAQDRLLSEAEALNLALAQARDEVDASTEEARLAAARRDALQAMVADLEAGRDASAERISELETAQLADAAAAQALRDRLADADTELTAMTLALEEQRRDAEETLTLLAAAQAARDELTQNLSAALLAQQQAEALASDQDALNTQLLAAVSAQQSAEAALAEAEAALVNSNAETTDLRDQLTATLLQQTEQNATVANLEERLAAALLAKEQLEQSITAVGGETSLEALQTQLAQALAARSDAQTEAERQADLLAVANAALSEEEALSAESQRQVALLNEQVAALRQQVGGLQELLNLAKSTDEDAQIQISELGTQLNTALARVAAEERRRRALEQAERERLEAEAALLSAEAQDLERFRSDFFGQIRDVLEGQDGVQVVGDRFVFSSEVLFQPGQATLSASGQDEIAKVGDLLLAIIDQIPGEIDWVIRVDGHTDDIPVGRGGRYRDNWELSQARALSVVRYMEDVIGVPPERLAANGFGEYQPINPANTPQARAQNRRIELKLTER